VNPREKNHILWGEQSPLSTFIGIGVVLMASGRTAFALVALGALLWVYGLTVLITSTGKFLFPRQGRAALRLGLPVFLGSFFLFLVSLLSPLLAMECGFIVILSPVICVGSGICERTASRSWKRATVRALMEALVLGGLTFALALIREPLAFGSLSIPGGSGGIILISDAAESVYFPLRVLSLSSGGFLLLGYGIALCRRLQSRDDREDNL